MSTLEGYVEGMIELSGGGGGGGSDVSYTDLQQSGTKIGILTIDSVDTDVYAPNPGDSVSYDPTIESGTKIGTLTINDTDYNLYSNYPGDEVSFTQVVSSGTKLGTISINGTLTNIYAPPAGSTVTVNQPVGTRQTQLTVDGTTYYINEPSILNNLTDVGINSPQNGQILKYDTSGAYGQWVNSNSSGSITKTTLYTGTEFVQDVTLSASLYNYDFVMIVCVANVGDGFVKSEIIPTSDISTNNYIGVSDDVAYLWAQVTSGTTLVCSVSGSYYLKKVYGISI